MTKNRSGESLQIVLNVYPDIEVIGTVDDGTEVLPSVERQRPDVILMDIRMPKMDGTMSTKICSKQNIPR